MFIVYDSYYYGLGTEKAHHHSRNKDFSQTSFQDAAQTSTPMMMGFLSLFVTYVYLEHVLHWKGLAH